MRRDLLILALLALGLLGASAPILTEDSPSAENPEERDLTPAGLRWMNRMLAHKLRLDNSGVWLLEQLMANPTTRPHFQHVGRLRLNRYLLFHDYSKVHPAEVRSVLQIHAVLPNLMGEAVEAHTIPSPPGSVPPGMRLDEMTPEQRMRWAVDRINQFDEVREQEPLHGLEPEVTRAYKFIAYVLDWADTGLMRDDYTQETKKPPATFIREHWNREPEKSKLEELGELGEFVLPTLRWLQKRGPGKISRYERHNQKYRDPEAIRMLMSSACLREKIRLRAGHSAH